MLFIRSNPFYMIQAASNEKVQAVFDTSFDKTVVLFDDAVVIVHFPLVLAISSQCATALPHHLLRVRIAEPSISSEIPAYIQL
jgi:hypothetical protein